MFPSRNKFEQLALGPAPAACTMMPVLLCIAQPYLLCCSSPSSSRHRSRCNTPQRPKRSSRMQYRSLILHMRSSPRSRCRHSCHLNNSSSVWMQLSNRVRPHLTHTPEQYQPPMTMLTCSHSSKKVDKTCGLEPSKDSSLQIV